MQIGVPKEIKNHEYRVGVTPAGVRTLTDHGHRILVETGAGAAIGFSDEMYRAMGAEVCSKEAVFDSAMVVKVKEPLPEEYGLLKEEQVLFTYLHLAPNAELVDALLDSRVTAIAYETVTDKGGRLPLLAPMSEIAGRLSVQMGAWALQMANGGSGTLLGGVPGAAKGKVAIIGGGVVGTNAAKMALGLGAEVTLMDNNLERLRYLDDVMGPGLKTRYSDSATLDEQAAESDLLIGAVLSPGKAAPKLITREHIAAMKTGAVLVDVSIDQGGCAETSRPTTHTDPIYEVDGVVHYCVANMPGATARTSTQALTNATMPYILNLADKGYRKALTLDRGLRAGLNACGGSLTHSDLANDLQRESVNPFLALDYDAKPEALAS